jgi:hypothetical protein
MASRLKDFIHHIDDKLHTHLLPSPKLDFIGDVHGYAIELEMLLEKMGYQHSYGTWHHAEHKAVFVGDMINRGPQSRKVIQIVRSMVDAGSAYAILGNHEINAILYFTKRKNGLPFRLPGPANKKMLDRIKLEYTSEKELERDIKWLRKLPLYYDFKQVRVVHAYWSQNHIDLLHGALNENKLKRKFLREIIGGGTSVSKAFMQTIKGVEFCFPPNLVVKDNLKVRRMYYRVKWWKSPINQTFEELSFETKFTLPQIVIPDSYISQFDIYEAHEPPVFVGHYCAGNTSLIPTHNICCVDACIANGGKLAAYRWGGESHLTEENLVFVDKRPYKTTVLQENSEF